MIVDWTIVPGLLLLAAELVALAALGYVVARTVLRQSDERMALAQGLVLGLALWGFVVNVVMYVIPAPAGVIAAWVVTLALGAGLAWRAGRPLRPALRTAAVFLTAVLGMLWVALACRQMLSLSDWEIHLGLAASIRAGGFPPVLPWQPGMPAPYHYGVDMLIGLLAPPFGPDLAFVTELVGAYVWVGFALTVATLLNQRGSWTVAVALAPLLLTAGAWTLASFDDPPTVAIFPLPAGAPPDDLLAALGEAYWPSPRFPWPALVDAPLGNVWTPSFPLAYALAFIVLERAVGMGRRWSWSSALTLGVLLGFLGLVSEAVALVALALWALLEAVPVMASWRSRASDGRAVLRAASGPLVGALLLAVSGGVLTGALTEASGGGLSVRWTGDLGRGGPLGKLIEGPDGLWVLGLGPLVVSAVAVLLAWRDRLVLALAAASGVFLLAGLVLHYDPFPVDVTRMAGHARNFALLGLLVALSVRLPMLRPRWRYAAGALVVALVVWPTAIAPVHAVGFALGRGPRFANAELGPQEHREWFLGRYALGRFTDEEFMSDRMASYIGEHTAAKSRILSPSPGALTVATGRPNASGFASVPHIVAVRGPAYADAVGMLDPAAVSQLGFDYVHASDEWLARLPPRALRRLENPDFFELLTRDGPDALYRVRPAFRELDADPASFEALRRAVPSAAAVYLSPTIDRLHAAHVASVLAHAQLFGEVDWSRLHALRTPAQTAPLSGRTPDVVVTSARAAPSSLPLLAQRRPVWANDDLAVYAPGGAVSPVAQPEAPTFSVRLSNVSLDGARIAFTATFADRAPERWIKQDWKVVPADVSAPWAFPQVSLNASGRPYEAAQWFLGQVVSGSSLASHVYTYDPIERRLSQQGDDGRFTAVLAGGSSLAPGTWMLVVGLQHGSPWAWEEVALIPVMQIVVADTGEVTYAVFEGALSVRLAE
ncbi:MAG: hypothetical protein OXG33_08355 [Chloroflexi bacterium]|nr:hypothetical protein [Chloroflexota bacterium]